ncbi:MAG: VOC family protein [Planctomycetes bacterium]|nr:VOC family protein [Planctomycetota bacterium]
MGEHCCSSDHSHEHSQAATATAVKVAQGTIVHFDFTVPDLKKAGDFYGKLFGWQFQTYKDNESWFQAGQPGGPCGCAVKGTPAADGKTVIYVNTDDIDASLKKATTLGAKTLQPKTEIEGGHGFFAKIRTPEGNVFGLYNRE